MSYAVTGVSGLGCIYFVSFYVVGCLVAVNVFSAFVIDAFLSQYEEGRALRATRASTLRSGSRAGDGAAASRVRHSARDDVRKAMFLEGDAPDKFDHAPLFCHKSRRHCLRPAVWGFRWRRDGSAGLVTVP